MNSWLRTITLLTVAIPMTSAAGAAQSAPRCDAAEYRQFDFWLGAWQVRTPDGKLAGTNHIEREYDGCVVHERYTGAKTYRGESLNIFDPRRKVWHQTWVDNQGLLLLLEGGWHGTSMVLEGKSLDASGKEAPQRITWTPNADGTVRQLWESSDASGKWTTVFDGKYSHQ
jgi:hypothetical protein